MAGGIAQERVDVTLDNLDKNNKIVIDRNMATFIDETLWHFGILHPASMHWYAVKDENDWDLFEWMVNLIYDYGIEAYSSFDRVCITFGDFRYWVMVAPLEDTTIIYRKPLLKQVV